MSRPHQAGDATTEPKFCPYCGMGSKNIVQVCTWDAESQEDPDNTTELDEYQCVDCNGRSFWV